MTDPPGRHPVSLDRQRERAVEALTAHYVAERIDTAGFETRLDRVYAAGTVLEIESAWADLPAHTAEPTGQTVSVRSGEDVRQHQVVVAFMGGATRGGGWKPARQTHALAIMGGIELDLRDARFAPGRTDFEVLALMGGIDVIVPPGLRVECEGFGLMGGFDGVEEDAQPEDGPTVRIRGLAIMGGVTVSVRLPGETARDGKRRLRLERKRKLRR